MSEWLKEHAWELIPSARADALKSHQHSSDQRVPATSIRVGVSSQMTVFTPGFGGHVTQF